MPVLHNRISNDALKAKMLAESEPRTTISFYKYFHIADPKATRDALYQLFTALNVFGRVYLAHEGINAQISVPASNVETFRAQLYAFDPALEGLRLNIALDDDGKSFWVLRMKVRDRIVADGIDDPHFDASNVGEYLQAAEVNAMLDDPDALFIDMRNHYEYEVGHFENALEIPADTFREQLPKAVEMMQAHKDKNIKGTGLGLSIAKHILIRHHGNLRISSSAQQGTTFTIYLPIHQTQDSPSTSGEG